MSVHNRFQWVSSATYDFLVYLYKINLILTFMHE